MNQIKDSIIYLCLITFVGVLADFCPEPELLKPCTCNETSIFCVDVTGAQLKDMFTKLNHLEESDKHYNYLTITGPGCDHLLENTFSDITFDVVVIIDAPNFKTIHTNAFQNNKIGLEAFGLYNLPALDVNNLFDIINKFRKIEIVHLVGLPKLKEIPSLAFKDLKNFDHLRINGTNIKTIHEKAFYKLNSLTHLEIINTSLNSIGQNIFVFSQESEYYLTIGLYSNLGLNCESFTAETFSKANRPLKLDFPGFYRYLPNEQLNRKQLTCMPEKVFRPFFEADNKNRILLQGIDFDCNECKSSWFKKETQFHDRIIGIKCGDGKNITDHANFKGC